jgi:uncharacterized protein (UPF0332 family)
VKKATGQLLEKGARAIHAAETLLGAKDADFAAERAYYAMFYAAQPLLHEKNLRFRKHAGVHAAFGEHFAKTGVLEPKFHRWLLDAFDKRLQGDYGIELIVTVEDVQQMIEQAREFLAEARRHLGVHE